VKAITYAGTEVLTGDDIAVALLEYGAALAEAGSAETVDVPIVDANGQRGTVTILVGPASQIVARDVPSAFEELVDEATVDALRLKARRLRPTATVDTDKPTQTDWTEGY
jgi:hypothetical protein